jgi:hypothetical protein
MARRLVEGLFMIKAQAGGKWGTRIELRTASLGIVRFSETMGADLRLAVIPSAPC